MTVFLNQLKHSFSRWIDLAETKKTYDDVVDLFLREQFLSACSSSLATYLREKGHMRLMSVTETAETAEKYRLAHPTETIAAKPKADVWSCSAVGGKTDSQKKNPNKQNWNQREQNGSNKQTDEQSCPNKQTGDNKTLSFINKHKPKRFTSGCFNFRGVGHISAQCLLPTKEPTVGCCIPTSTCSVCNVEHTLTKPCGHDFDSVGVACLIRIQRMGRYGFVG